MSWTDECFDKFSYLVPVHIIHYTVIDLELAGTSEKTAFSVRYATIVHHKLRVAKKSDHWDAFQVTHMVGQ